jgi:hypothetical protein
LEWGCDSEDVTQIEFKQRALSIETAGTGKNIFMDIGGGVLCGGVGGEARWSGEDGCGGEEGGQLEVFKARET